MGGFIVFLVIFFFVVVPLAGLATRVIPMRLEGVTFRDTASPVAWLLVHQYAIGTFEQRFGYPTGYFNPDDKQSEQGKRLIMREMQPTGAITDGCSASLGAVGAAGADAGMIGCLWVMMIFTIGSPFFIVSFLDRFCRALLRSKVEVRFTQSGADTIASFSFYGPSGYVLKNRYAQAFARPQLPPTLAPPAPASEELHLAENAA
jgi:hypothetical protein